MEEVIAEAQRIFATNFQQTTCFERAIFFSWYCGIGDCAYCYMASKKHKRTARRSMESILAEVALCRLLGWELGFISGGNRAYAQVEFRELLRNIHLLYGEKVWINVGALSEDELAAFKPYLKGVVASIETLEPALHRKVCPSKPIEPFERMLEGAGRLGLQRAMTLIIGLGETRDDFPLVQEFIAKRGITKVHLYSLNPQKGTAFEHVRPPKPEYHAEWIARTRVAFPKIDIQAGIWLDRVSSVSLLLQAGANSISKYPAHRYFGSRQSVEIELQAARAGRRFSGTLTKLPETKKYPQLDRLEQPLRRRVEKKLHDYLSPMRSCSDAF